MPINRAAFTKSLAEDQGQAARFSVLASPDVAPEQMTRAQDIASRRGVSPLAVVDDLKHYDEQDQVDAIADAAKGSPAFARWVQKPGNATVAKGNTGKLSALSLALEAIRSPFSATARVFQPAVNEGVRRSDVGQTFQRATTGMFANTIESAADVVNQTNPWRMLSALPGVSPEVKAKANDPLGVGQLQTEAAAVGAEVRADDQVQAKAIGGRPSLDVLRSNPAKFVEQATAYYMGQAAQSAPSMIAGMATRRPLVGGSIMGGSTAANTYSDLRADGVGRADAWEAAALTGAIEVGSESLSIGNWVKGRLIKSIAEGAGGEALAGATQLEIEANAKGEKTTWAQRVDAVLDSAILGGAMDASMTAGHIALTKPDVKKVDTIQRLGASGDGAQKIGAILDAARDVMNNKVSGASTLAREAAGESHVYLAADQARVLFQSERATADQFVGELVGDETALAEAEATGGDIAIPMAAFVERISQLSNADEVARHLRLDPEQLSRADLEDEATLNGWLDELDTDAAAERAKPENIAARDQVSSDVLGMLMASGRYREADAQLQANLVGRVFDTLGSREGRSAWELYSDYKLRINGQGGNQVSSTKPNTLTAETDSLLTDIRNGTLPSDQLVFGHSLVPFLKKMGGLQDFRGELKSMDAQLTTGLVKKEGVDLDYAREAAAEAGYLPEDSTVADFLQLLDKELRGEPVYRVGGGDESLLARRNKANDIQAAIDQSERLRSMPRAEFEALSNQELHDILFGTDKTLWQKAKTLLKPEVSGARGRIEANEANNFDQQGGAFDESAYRPAVIEFAKSRWGDMVAPNGRPIWQNFTAWFGDSKVVDAEGKPLVVYHGTTAARFDSYAIPAFFTSDRNGAEWYMQDDSGRMESAYIAVKNPLDISTHSGAFKIVQMARAAGVDIESDIADDNSPWSFFAPEIAEHSAYDGSNVADLVYIPNVRAALESAGFDGIETLDTLENGNIPVWVAFNSEQIKSATGNAGNFDAADPRILYQKKDESPELVVTHNLSEANLLHALKIGGIPVPSLAITRGSDALTGFGEITLIGDSNLADPKQGAKAFGADIYSPRYPSTTYKLDSKAKQNVIRRLGITERDWRIESQMDAESLTQIDEFKTYADKVIGGTSTYSQLKQVADEVLSEAGAKSVIFDGFTNNGNRRYKEHTLENVVKILKKELRGGENFNYGTGSARAKFTPQFRSLKAIRDAKGRLQDKASFEAVKKEVEDELFSLANSLSPYYQHNSNSFGYTDTVLNLIGDSARGSLDRNLEEYGFDDVPDDVKASLRDYMQKLRDMPTEYFEVKHLRTVGIGEFRVAVVPSDVSEKARSALENAGVSVVEYSQGDDASRRAAVSSAANESRLLFQNKIHIERGQLAIGANRQMEVTLFDGADMSTFVHELGHLFLEVMQDQAARNPELKADLDKLREWVGNDGGEFTTEQHEQIARGFEAYLREGKAPAPELRSMFGRMRAWLVDVYKSLKELNVDLTDDVRGVFDRIIASDEEIEAAQVKQGMSELPVGDNLLTPDQLAKYREDLAGATEEARARALDLMNKAAKRQQLRWWKDELRALKAEAQKKFDALPEVVAWRAMQGREGTPKHLNFKLSRDLMVKQYGAKWVKDNLLHLRVYSAEGGVHPDIAGAAFGFDSGDALLRALANMKDTRARMMEAAEALMRERHGDPMTDGTLSEKSMDFVHGSRRVRVLETELALLSKLANEPVPPVRAIREYARRKIAALKVRSLRPNNYLVAERKAANAALKAAAAGNWAEALKHKRAQAVQSILYSEARKAQARAQSTVKMLKAAAKPSTRKRVGKAGKSYFEALDAILSLFELRTVSAKTVVRREALRQWVARMQENDQNTAIDSALLERVEREDVVNLADLTGAELEAVRESVSNILALARLKTNFLTKRGKMDREEAKAAMIEALEKLETRDRTTDADRTMFERLVDFKDAVGNWLLQPETIIEWLDKGTKGIFHDLLWLPSNEAEAKRNELKREVGAQLEAAFAGLSKESRNDLDSKRLIPSLNRSLSGHTILSALLNTGNAQNRAKLEGGGIVLGDEIVQLSPQALSEMFATLNAEQVRLAQGIWDSVNSLWPHIVEMEESVSGFAPPKVESQTVTIQSKDGPITLTGGYYPVKYDPRGSKFGLDEADEQAKRALAGQAAVKASTSKGHLEKRTEYLAPLKLDYHNILTEHLSGVMSDIAYRRFLAQVFTILSDPDISRRIDGRLGPQATKHLRRAFERGAVGNVALAGPLFGPLQGVANTAMTNVAVAALGLRLPLALANIVTAPMLAASRISPKWLVQGFTEFYKNPSKNGEMIRSLSDVMRKRAEAPNVDYQAVLDNLKGGNSIRRQITELSMSVHRWIVPLAENAIWLSGYKQAIAGGASITESVDAADKLVVQTQTKSASKDLSALEANPYLRPFMMFAGPLVVINNRLQDAGLRGGLHGDVDSVPQALGVWLAMAAGGSWAFELMMGRGPDDDDDDGLDAMDWVKWCALKLGLMPFSALPVLRDAASYVESGRAPTSPLASATVNLANAVKTYKNLLDDEKEVETSKVVKDTTKAVSTVVPLPTNQMIRTGEYVMAVGTGEHAMENPAKEAYYLLQGPPKD